MPINPNVYTIHDMENDLKQMEIVFVYLGQHIPRYLFRNLEHIADLFPNTRVNFVISSSIPKNTIIPVNVNIYIYHTSEKLNDLIESKSIDLAFRKGFWRYSLERLLAIELVHTARSEHSLLYIESDVLVLPGFPLQEFSNLKKIHWMLGDSETDIASVVYFPNHKLTKQFSEDLNRYIQDSLQPTDMKGLRSLRENYPSRYGLLPIGNTNFPALTKSNKDTLKSSTNYFNGVFDAAMIGMWLTGIDPRNTYGFKKYCATSMLQTEKSIINPSIYKLILSEERKLYFVFEQKQLQIYNLHIHSKSEILLSKDWHNELNSLVKNANNNMAKTEFLPQVLAGLIVENFFKKTFTLFVYNSPPFHFLRKFVKTIRKMNKSLWLN